MKKVLSIIFLSFFLLTSCWTTEKVFFSELPQEKKDEIIAIGQDIVAESFTKLMPIAFNFDLNEEEKDRQSDEIIAVAEKRFQNEIVRQYPNVIFWEFEEFNQKIGLGEGFLDNTEDTQEERVIISKWDNHLHSPDEWLEISVKILNIEDLETREFDDGFYTYNANNNFVKIRLQWENTGRRLWFIPVNQYSIILHTADGYEFRPVTTIQVWRDNRPDWYVWCISCSMNPWDKWYEDILFDLSIEQVVWWQLQLSEYNNIFFQL